MKVLYCGDRNWTDQNAIEQSFSLFTTKPKELIIVHGGAKGADTLSGLAAEKIGISDIRVYYAQWGIYHKAAGPIRNEFMYGSELPDLVVAFHDNIAESKGTKHMLNYAKSKGTPCYLIKHNREYLELYDYSNRMNFLFRFGVKQNANIH